MTQTAYAVLYLEINLISVALVGIIRYRTLGISRMVSQRNLSMALDAEMLLFLLQTAKTNKKRQNSFKRAVESKNKLQNVNIYSCNFTIL